MAKLRKIVLIHEMRMQGLSISAISRKTGLDRRTVREYLQSGPARPDRLGEPKARHMPGATTLQEPGRSVALL